MSEQSGGITVFIGTYTRGTRSEGIYVHRFDPESGALTPASVASGAENPSFLALRPGGRFLYAASEIESFDGRAQGAIYAYAVDARDGRLTFLNARGSVGRGPCHASVDAAGRWLLAANYHGGSVCAMPIEPDGRLAPASDFVQHTGSSVNPERQDQAHAHSINLDPRNRFAYVPDLGQDKIVIYKPDFARGALIPNAPAAVDLPPGSGPRHFAFAPNAHRAYAINELASTITAFDRDAESGALEAFQTISTLPADFAGANTTADIHVHPSGKFVYGSNRGHDSVAMFAVNESDGRLTALGHQSTLGRTPRNFAIDPSGGYLLAANQDSDTIVSFAIDAGSGTLAPTGDAAEVPSPVCVVFGGSG